MRNAVPGIVVCALGVVLVSCGGSDPLRGFEEPIGDPSGDWALTFHTLANTCNAFTPTQQPPQDVRVARDGDFVDWQVEGQTCGPVHVPYNDSLEGYVLFATESGDRVIGGCNRQTVLTTRVVITSNEITGTTILDMTGPTLGYYGCGAPIRSCRTIYEVTGRRCSDCYDGCN